MPGRPHVVGVDIGTSGVRVAALDERGAVVGTAARTFGDAPRSPALWWRATQECLAVLGGAHELAGVAGIGVDGTSGTMLAIDDDGAPVGVPIMYNEPAGDAGVVAAIEAVAPDWSAARGANSALARAAVLLRRPGAAFAVHQADWLVGKLSGRFDRSDFNNALKTGFDPAAECWPDWIAAAGVDAGRLPAVVAPGTPVAPAGPAALALGFAKGARLHVGTTDGCASFLATGAAEIGEGVTALGSTMTLKQLAEHPVNAPRYGIYSHRLGDRWLVGGASNTGGAAILSLFPRGDLPRLTAAMRPDEPTGLSYYPLPKPGERFPVADPDMAPRLEPRPGDEARFFQGVLEGIAEVEAMAYRRLAELGGPPLASLRTVGGGAANAGWTRIRQRKLGVPFLPPLSEEACVGTALLVLRNLDRPMAA